VRHHLVDAEDFLDDDDTGPAPARRRRKISAEFPIGAAFDPDVLTGHVRFPEFGEG